MIFAMTELEDRLRSADAPAAMAAAQARLADIRDRLDSARAAGLPPADYARSEAVMAALTAAKAVLSTFPATKEF